MHNTIEYVWGLYDVKRDDHFNEEATPQEIAAYMMDPDVSLRLQRWHPEEGREDCHVKADGTFEANGWFALGQGHKVPKRYVQQLERWVRKYGYALDNVDTFGDPFLAS